MDVAFGDWLDTGEYRSLTSALGESAPWMRLLLDDDGPGPRFELDGTSHPVALEGAVSIEPGPGGRPSLRFADAAWAAP